MIAAVLLAKTLLKPGGATNSKQIPDLTGNTVQKARDFLASPSGNGFTLGVPITGCEQGKSDSTPKGQIFQQDPAATGGYIAPKAINYCVSTGPAQAMIQAGLKGKPAAVVQAQLTQLGFKVDGVVAQQVADDHVPVGSVVDILDTATNKSVLGLTIDQSSALTWTVSSGPATTPVPDVTNQSFTDAKNLLNSKGFQVAQVTQNSNSVQAGYVISQNPPGNTNTSPSAKITLMVSSGPAPTTPPSTSCDPVDPTCQPTGGPPSNPGQPSNPSGTATSAGALGGLAGGPGGTPTSTKHG